MQILKLQTYRKYYSIGAKEAMTKLALDPSEAQQMQGSDFIPQGLSDFYHGVRGMYDNYKDGVMDREGTHASNYLSDMQRIHGQGTQDPKINSGLQAAQAGILNSQQKVDLANRIRNTAVNRTQAPATAPAPAPAPAQGYDVEFTEPVYQYNPTPKPVARSVAPTLSRRTNTAQMPLRNRPQPIKSFPTKQPSLNRSGYNNMMKSFGY